MIADQVLIPIQLPENVAQRYVTTNIKHRIGEEKARNMRFEDDLMDRIDIEGLCKKLNVIKKITRDTKFGRSDSDLKASKIILDHLGNISLRTAASDWFWNGLSLWIDEIHDYICWRWGYDKRYFRENQTVNYTDERNKIIRFITTSNVSRLRKHTLARIWWTAKIFPKKHLKLVWKQQDTVDRFLEKPLKIFDKNLERNDLLITFVETYSQYDKQGKFDNFREAKVRDLLQWMRLLDEKLLLKNFSKEELDDFMEDIFITTIKKYKE